MRYAILATALACAAPAFAADDAELFAMRDLVAPGMCSLSTQITSITAGDQRLHQVPCAPLPSGQTDVVIQEVDGVLRPMAFAVPNLEIHAKSDGTIAGRAVGPRSISTSMILPNVMLEEGQPAVVSVAPVAPGLGDGQIRNYFWLGQGDAKLAETTYFAADGRRDYLWPAREPSVSEVAMPVPEFSLAGFNPMEPIQASGRSVLEILAAVEIEFPVLGEQEGRPRLRMFISQEGTQLAADMQVTGWADDSVAGEVFRVLMVREGEIWRVTEMGRAQICARGSRLRSLTPCP